MGAFFHWGLVASCLVLALCMNMLHVIMKLAYLVLEAKIVDWFCLADLDILDHEFCFVNSWWSIFFKAYWSGKLLIFTWDLLLTPFYCLLVLTCHLNNCNCLFYFEISSVCTLIKVFLRFELFSSGDGFHICGFELSPKAFGGYFFSGSLKL